MTEAARRHGLTVHMDGARFANAVAALGCSPADLSWRAGVDVLCFGGVKNGLAAGEAVLFFDKALAEEFEWRVKQAGQLNSKMRLVAAPWVGAAGGRRCGSRTPATPTPWRSGCGSASRACGACG